MIAAADKTRSAKRVTTGLTVVSDELVPDVSPRSRECCGQEISPVPGRCAQRGLLLRAGHREMPSGYRTAGASRAFAVATTLQSIDLILPPLAIWSHIAYKRTMWAKRKSRAWARTRRLSMAAAGIAGVVAQSSDASAVGHPKHLPVDSGYGWVCLEGNGAVAYAGNCYYHQGNPTAVYWHFYGSWTAANQNAVIWGAAVWDQTNGHQYNTIQNSNGWGFAVTWETTQICNSPGAVGCTANPIQYADVYMTTSMQFKNPSYVTHTAAHEFGHSMGLGHGGDPNSPTRSGTATMPTANDVEGRCQIYGHTMGLWGGCPCPK